MLSGDVETWQFISVTAEGRKNSKDNRGESNPVEDFLVGSRHDFCIDYFLSKGKKQ
mgnify:CR=1